MAAQQGLGIEIGVLGSAFIGIEDGRPSILRVHYLMENLKHKSERGPRKVKVGSLKQPGTQATRAFCKGTSWMGGLAPHLVVQVVTVSACSWRYVYVRRMSWTWMPGQAKAACQALLPSMFIYV